MKKILLFAIFMTSLQCGVAKAVPKDFDPHHYPIITLGNYPDSLLGKGTGTIEGTLHIKTQFFGDLAYGVQEVYAIPASPFSLWYVEDIGYMIENPYAKDAIQNYPTDLVKFTRVVKSDENGNFLFTGLPDGKYLVWSYMEHEVDSGPIRKRSQLAMGADGAMVAIPTIRKGLKIRTDNVVIGATGRVDAAGGVPGFKIESFELLGEFTCCSAEL